MDIVKKLSLNKTPKDVDNNSIVAAKNIMTDNTGSYITNEPGFDVAFTCPNDEEFIVGCINCAKEIVIFTYCLDGEKSRIYRYYDNGQYVECKTSWTYNGGTIIGAYTYNYKKELIIAVSEYDAKDENGNTYLIPLKSWNLDTDYNSVSYSIEDFIPKFNVTHCITNNGSLLSGVYTFFIRFKIADETYTKWFQITDDKIIVNRVSKERPNHYYELNGDVVLKSSEDFREFWLNDNGISSSGIQLVLDFEDNCNFSEYQIGYIYKRNSEIVGRIKADYTTNTTTIDISDNTYFEEISIDELLEEPHQFYNVKNLINYNNRLYIANYKEYKNENLQPYADKIDIEILAKEQSSNADIQTISNVYGLNISAGNGSDVYGGFQTYVSGFKTYKEGDDVYIDNPKKFVKDYIAGSVYLRNYNTGDINGILNTLVLPQRREDDYYINEKLNFGLYIIPKNEEYGNELCIYNTDSTIPVNYKIKLNISGNDYSLIFKTDEKEYVLDTTNHGFNISIADRYTKQHIYSPSSFTSNFFDWYFKPNSDKPTVSDKYYSPTGGINFSTVGTITTNTIITPVNKANNNRTLIPRQVYNFFIHYVRSDGSATNGFKICNITPNFSDKDKPILYPKFSNIEIPVNYVGYFITYEDVEKNVEPLVVYRKLDESNNSFLYKATSSHMLYDSNNVFGNDLVKINGSVQISAISKTINKKQTVENHVSFRSNNANTSHITTQDVISFTNLSAINNAKPYSKTTKTLYRLTNICYDDACIIDDSFLPGFYTKENIIWYVPTNGNNGLIMSPVASNVIDDSGVKTAYKLHNVQSYSYSFVSTEAYSIKQDYSQGSVSLIGNEGNALGVYYNKILSPDKLSDFLELKESYKAKPDKIYTNYSKDYNDTFSNTIYRSDVMSDESLINNFRHFDYSNYKNIFENKGDIVNVIGIGLYLLVHTEHALFVFDRSPKLTQKSQLDIPDTFDISYQEVMPANEGFGGLANKDESILTKFGYIWFDKINKYLFLYENGTAKIISQDIQNFIKSLDIDTVRFAEDTDNNRLLICIYLNHYYTDDWYDEGKANRVQASITISYSFITNSFISLHDYSFTDNYRTYNNSYLFDKRKDRKRLYKFDKSSFSYLNLLNNNSMFYPKYNQTVPQQPSSLPDIPKPENYVNPFGNETIIDE